MKLFPSVRYFEPQKDVLRYDNVGRNDSKQYGLIKCRWQRPQKENTDSPLEDASDLYSYRFSVQHPTTAFRLDRQTRLTGGSAGGRDLN